MNALFDSTKLRPFAPEGECNTADAIILENVRTNIRRFLPQVQPYHQNGLTALLVCGGASLLETEKELVEAYWAGGKIVAVNGAYQWCIDRNLKPSAMVLLDARSTNTRFVQALVPGCKYLLASQCAPQIFNLCSGGETWIWHACGAGEPELELMKQHYFGNFYPISMGTTVGIKALYLLEMLGWSKIDVFGLDSCWLNGAHHAYDQPENAADKMYRIWVRPRDRDDLSQLFHCSPWHAQQVKDFQALVKLRGKHINLHVRGPGLIATMLRTCADLKIEEPTDGPSKSEGPHKRNPEQSGVD